MAGFICPICGNPLEKSEKSYICGSAHCFDISKSGYVNLLLSQKSGNHGDDKVMVKARKDFLDAGYYLPLRGAVTDALCSFIKAGNVIVDSGCGEGWYTNAFEEALCAQDTPAEVFAVDISKVALSYAAKRSKKVNYAVASAYKLPFADESADAVVSLFAPYAGEEFLRVLKKGGRFITAFPLENHLMGLKKAVYDTPYKNETENTELEGFSTVSITEIKNKITLRNNLDIMNLFMMTPYYYKTGESDQKKLLKLNALDTETEFSVAVYVKK